nr:GNAT family N-acetyltransferase [Deinococcus frigens]
MLEHSLTWITAFDGTELVGFVNVAWDGGVHAFLLDTTVHPGWARRGIGTELVRRAAAAAREHGGLEWLHVDYEPHLSGFYELCGFTPTPAGLLRLDRFFWLPFPPVPSPPGYHLAHDRRTEKALRGRQTGQGRRCAGHVRLDCPAL